MLFVQSIFPASLERKLSLFFFNINYFANFFPHKKLFYFSDRFFFLCGDDIAQFCNCRLLRVFQHVLRTVFLVKTTSGGFVSTHDVILSAGVLDTLSCGALQFFLSVAHTHAVQRTENLYCKRLAVETL